MANPTWPGTLPPVVLIEGYDERFGNGKLRTQMDVGPAKQRRRFTATPRPLKVSLHLDEDQAETLRTFYETTLGFGALAFDWIHPRTQAAVTLRFAEEAPQLRPAGDTLDWIATLDLEIMP